MSTLTNQSGIYSAFYFLTQELHARIWTYLEPLGVTQTTFSYLLYIDGHTGCKVSELVDALRLDKAAVTRNLSSLGRLGYVDRQSGKYESRAYVLYLTPAGKTIVKAVSGIVQEWEGDLCASLGEEAYRDVLAALDHARDHFLRERVRHAPEAALRAPFAGMPFFY